MKTADQRPKLLCVDDEEHILAALRRVFADERFDTECVQGGEQALAVLERETVAVVVSDQRMPGMSGTELLRTVRERWPETARIILSGFAELSVVVAAINDGEINKFIAKPWNDDALRETVRACFEHYELALESRETSVEIARENDDLRANNAELELRYQALELYQEVLDQMPVGLFGVGADGTIALCNAQGRDLFTQADEPPLGAHYRDVFPTALARELALSIDGDCARHVQIHRAPGPIPAATLLDARIQPLQPSARERGVLVLLYPLTEATIQ